MKMPKGWVNYAGAQRVDYEEMGIYDGFALYAKKYSNLRSGTIRNRSGESVRNAKKRL